MLLGQAFLWLNVHQKGWRESTATVTVKALCIICSGAGLYTGEERITRGLLTGKIKRAGGLVARAIVARRAVAISLTGGEVLLSGETALAYGIACVRQSRK